MFVIDLVSRLRFEVAPDAPVLRVRVTCDACGAGSVWATEGAPLFELWMRLHRARFREHERFTETVTRYWAVTDPGGPGAQLVPVRSGSRNRAGGGRWGVRWARTVERGCSRVVDAVSTWWGRHLSQREFYEWLDKGRQDAAGLHLVDEPDLQADSARRLREMDPRAWSLAADGSGPALDGGCAGGSRPP
ncbi:hypothetical protein CD790_11255 [Streptomyces sp. SAJ15]|nr:hypothetical protein CD790_11255 [Streptomyces sp. SAJ15]